MSNSVVLARPTRRGSVHDAPLSEPNPTLVNAIMNEPFSEISRRSHAKASAAPAPAATPFTTAITGLGSSVMASTRGL